MLEKGRLAEYRAFLREIGMTKTENIRVVTEDPSLEQLDKKTYKHTSTVDDLAADKNLSMGLEEIYAMAFDGCDETVILRVDKNEVDGTCLDNRGVKKVVESAQRHDININPLLAKRYGEIMQNGYCAACTRVGCYSEGDKKTCDHAEKYPF